MIRREEPARDTPYVAFLVKRFPRLSETFVLNEFLELRRQGVALRLFAIMDPHEPCSQPEALALAGEVTYLRCPSPWLLLRVAARNRRGTLSALRWVIPRRRGASWMRLAEALILVDALEGTPVHLHVHWAHAPADVAFLAHRIAGIPWSLTTHAKDLYTMPAGDIADRCAQAGFVATCTSANIRYLRDVVGVDPDKLVLCRHGVALERFSCTRRPEPARLLSVGRLVPKKGFDVLLDACALLASQGVAFELDIVGDGPQRAHLEARIAELGLASVVHLHHGRPQPELVGFFARAAAFVLACAVQSDGDRDGVPNVILEAMASGVAVVATEVSGIPEVLEHTRTGLLVAPRDPTALAGALRVVLDDPAYAERLGSAAAAFVRTHLELSRCVHPVAGLLAGHLERREDRVALQAHGDLTLPALQLR